MSKEQDFGDMSFGRGFGHGFSHHGFSHERSFERGSLKFVILSVINECPRHGYDIIREMEEKFHGFYAPSAGSVYPILQLLEDRNLVTGNQENGKKIYTITAEGKKELEENSEKLAHVEGHMHHRFGGDRGERLRGLMDEARQTMHFIFRKADSEILKDPEMMKKLRVAFANFRSEVEKILSDPGKDKK